MKEVFNPDLFVAKWYCSQVGPENMPQFAADALEAGYDGPALRRLAGLIRPNSREIGSLFQEALAEIGATRIHSKNQAALFLGSLTAKAIVDGQMDPIEGCSILSHYAVVSGYQNALAQFDQLDGALSWGEHAPSKRELVEDIIREARKLLASVPD